MALALTLGCLPMTTLANEEPAPQVSKTTGPVHGMSVSSDTENKEYRVLWPGHHMRKGTVESVRGDTVKVNTGELLPRYLSAREAGEKGMHTLTKGDQLQLVVNDQNVVVDYHLVGKEPWHRIVRGRLAQPLPVGHEWAVIRPERGNEEAFAVRPLARSKVSAIPVNVDAIFLMDETNKIIDATFGSESTLEHQTAAWKKSPPKAPYQRVEGTVLRSPGWVVIKTEDGKQQTYEARPHLRDRLAKAEGRSVVLMIDDENKISDVAGTGM
jgi:hypothetical protein